MNMIIIKPKFYFINVRWHGAVGSAVITFDHEGLGSDLLEISLFSST